jgi:nondiscriminating aspartyl-tRNA synthetase
MLRTHYSSQISEKDSGKKVTVAGWVQKMRDLGKVRFIILRDRDGEIQVTIKESKDLSDAFSKLVRESVLSIEGTVQMNKAAPGGKEIIPSKITVLAEAQSPLPLETDSRIQSELETRIDYRYLDLRKKEVAAIFKIKDVIYRSFIDYLEKEGFIMAHTPCIIASATEGGTNLFPLAYFDKEAFLVQSPQLYKQMLMASGLDKVMIITPAFRAEEHNTTYHLNECIQMDIETAFVENEQGALKYAEGVINYIYKQVEQQCKEQLEILGRSLEVPKLPFKQITYDEAVKILQKDGIKIKWGEDLTREAEKALCKHFNPLIVLKYPTDVRAFYSMPEPGNEKISRSYDMLIDGLEAMSGAQRIHKYDELIREMKRRKMNPKNFEFYTNAFRYGMPSHAGWSFGLERLTMLICGKANVREAVLWPRDRTRLTP